MEERCDCMGGGGNYGREGGGPSRHQQFGGSEVTTSNAHPSLVLGNLGEINTRTPKDLVGAGPIHQPRQRLIWTRHIIVQQQSEPGRNRVGDIEQYQGQSRAEPMCRRVWLLVREEFQLDRTRWLMKEQLSLQQQ
jgi:hypothetical protein